jgi:hypothetical protein
MLRLRDRGLTSPQIGARFGLTGSAVRTIFRRIDEEYVASETPSDLTVDDRRDRLGAMLKRGWGMASAARALGITYDTANNDKRWLAQQGRV